MKNYEYPSKEKKMIQSFDNVSSLKMNFLDKYLAVTELCCLLSSFSWPENIFLRI
jgi:hypothetical protein